MSSVACRADRRRPLSVGRPLGDPLSTPRDYNQPPWPQRPDPRQRPQQAGNPLSQQPTQWAQVPPQPSPAAAQRGQPAGQWGQAPGQYGRPTPPPVLPSKPKSSASKNKPFIIAAVLIAVIIIGAIA